MGKYGCPSKHCEAQQRYSEQLVDLPCKDPSLEALEAMDGWNTYWMKYTDYWKYILPTLFPVIAPFVSAVRKGGCDELHKDPFKNTQGVCLGNGEFASVRAFCPIACGCNKTMRPGCPRKCSGDQTLAQ